jgi:hypothetical protein
MMSGSIYKCKPVYKDGKVLVGYWPAYPPYWNTPRYPVSYTCKGQLLAAPTDHPAYLPFSVDEWSPTTEYNLWDVVKAWYPGNGQWTPAQWKYFTNRLSGYTNYNFHPITNPEPCAQRWSYGNHWQEYYPCGGEYVPDWSPTYPIWDSIARFKYNGKYWWIEVGSEVEEPPWYCPDPPSETTYGWHEYVPASSSNYSSIPPFGGIGKTPPKYRVSVIETYRHEDYLGLYHTTSANYQMVLDQGMWGGAVTVVTYVKIRKSSGTGYDEYTETWTGTGYLWLLDYGVEIGRWKINYGSTDERILLSPYKITDPLFQLTGAYPYCNQGCCLKGTRSDTYVSSGVDQYQRPYSFTLYKQVSWRPEDCTYTVWNNTSVYDFDACVTYAGKFFKACILNGPGTAAGVVAPQDTDPEICTGSNVWRVV